VYKKLGFILFLAFLLGLLLYLKPFNDEVRKVSKIENILPNADIVGRVYLLDFLTESTDLMLFNEIAQRQFLTSEFVLSMAKQYGLDVQSPVYIFANERGDFGGVVPLFTAQKLKSALDRISLDNNVRDTIIGKDKIYQIEKYKLNIFHRDHFLFIYLGDHFEAVYHKYIAKDRKVVAKNWKDLLANPIFPNENLVLYSQNQNLKQFGIEHAYLAHDSDSSGFHLKTCLTLNDSIPFFINDSGLAIEFSQSSKRIINLHANTKVLSEKSRALVIEKLADLTGKISFPIEEFMDVWAGDFCFEEGGYYLVSEKYIETELDENFETTQVEKIKYKNVPRYSLMFTTDDDADFFLEKLLKKGILTKEGDLYRFLFSPQLKLRMKGNQVVFYSTKYPPNIIPTKRNEIKWSFKDTQFEFQVDSLSDKRVFGSLDIPMEKILSTITSL
jgi:hypothetical protein